jgi:cellobiose phosphorylase
MYRLTVETLLGLQLDVDRLRIAPCVPAHWASYKIHYRYRETVYHITVKRVGAQTGQVIRVTVDGAVADGAGVGGAVVSGIARPQGLIPLVDDRREHYVEVELS